MSCCRMLQSWRLVVQLLAKNIGANATVIVLATFKILADKASMDCQAEGYSQRKLPQLPWCSQHGKDSLECPFRSNWVNYRDKLSHYEAIPQICHKQQQFIESIEVCLVHTFRDEFCTSGFYQDSSFQQRFMLAGRPSCWVERCMCHTRRVFCLHSEKGRLNFPDRCWLGWKSSDFSNRRIPQHYQFFSS